MTALTTVRFALAGTRTDSVRILLTALGAGAATLGLLAVATVLSIPTGGGDNPDAYYTNGLLAEPGLRPGPSVALVLTTIPVLFFVAQCSRLGAPARDRRLAAFRMGGATPAQTARIAATETGVAAALGALLGAAVYFAGRAVLDAPGPSGMRPLPTDVLPPLAVMVAILVGIPVLAIALSLLLMRRVSVTPFGVVRRSRDKKVRPWPGVLVVVGLGGWVAFTAAGRVFQTQDAVESGRLFLRLGVVCTLLVALGLALGTGWIAYTLGRLLHRVGRRPAALLAGRRLMADPWAGSRLLGVIVITTLFGSGAAAVHSVFATGFRADDLSDRAFTKMSGEEYLPRDTSFYETAFDLIQLAVVVALTVAVASLLVMLAEQLVTRRRSLAALVAGGTPRPVLARAQLLQTVAPLVPAVLLATAAGTVMAFSALGREVRGGEFCDAAGNCTPPVTLTVPIPWADLAVIAGGSVLAVLVVTAIGLLFLRSSTDVAELRTE
ncbi:MAG: FtsX-like permease family protein [Streptosporangiales bacterium]|nr:FtsX-like permease family protein [Streptosporangiales bacterium]